ncbi:hypothetical protein V1478_006761 [Vespula squamosa]|uniref:Uncharacterized protein n=1 Tax=Vespula squamosa TaxID=30214 RepID=A0ABD2B0T7_VESSQ
MAPEEEESLVATFKKRNSVHVEGLNTRNAQKGGYTESMNESQRKEERGGGIELSIMDHYPDSIYNPSERGTVCTSALTYARGKTVARAARVISLIQFRSGAHIVERENSPSAK